MKRTLFLTATTLLLAFGLSTPKPLTAQFGCGFKPIKPIIPVGCADLVPQCSCDANGKNCAWVWICTKRKAQ